MSKLFLYISLILFLAFHVSCGNFSSDIPPSGVVKFYGNSFYDYGVDVKTLGSDGFVLLGTSEDTVNSTDILIIKTDLSGNEQDVFRLGSEESSEVAGSFVVDSDNSIIVAGKISSPSSETNELLLMKIDKNGQTVWSNQEGSLRENWRVFFEDNANQACYSINKTSDGGYILAGTTDLANPGNGNPAGRTDILIVKTNSNGELQWYKMHGGAFNDAANEVKQLADGGYIIAGNTESFNEFGQSKTNAIVIRTNINGVQTNKLTYGGDDDDTGQSVEIMPDGTFVLIGSSKSGGAGGQDIYMIKIGQTLQEIEWEKYIGGSADDEGSKVVLMQDSNFLILGTTSSFGQGNSDIYLSMASLNGEVVWQKFFGYNGYEKGKSLIVLDNGEIALIGSSEFENNSMITFIKVFNDGNFID